MKKLLLTFTALSMSAAVSACAMHDEQHTNGTTQQSEMSHGGWDHKEHMQMMAQGFFDVMDKNGDGVVTRREYSDYTREWFREADTNHDGKLTLEEVKAQLKREKEKMKSEHHRHHDEMTNGDNTNNENENNQNDNNQSNY